MTDITSATALADLFGVTTLPRSTPRCERR
jgi:hypothetical protein